METKEEVDPKEDVDLKSVAVVGLLVVVLGALIAWALLGGISRGESAKALYEAGGTVVSKTLGGPPGRSGFFVDAEPNGRDVRRIRVEVSEAEWSDLEVGGAFPAGSESARDAAGLVDEGDGARRRRATGATMTSGWPSSSGSSVSD